MHHDTDHQDLHDTESRCLFLLQAPCPIPRGLLLTLLGAAVVLVAGVVTGVTLLVSWLLR